METIVLNIIPHKFKIVGHEDERNPSLNSYVLVEDDNFDKIILELIGIKIL